ncbi:hypothetical protein [Nocardioides bizhenqiangii]|uniref:PknH-like extracellular domain-containing protein n=1 Tax=Nocardioides bizhenqiangii TaxID=3095076 RepID=A0ABZ0ZN72_9ACTN|nr:hypothetical protein [Nocardioides sp. HM61]WQQ25672.1 hypothetical protein SHK19_17105 [Nocardioides sp. HM61]
MSDPIEKLNSLGDALEGAPMPRPASEIRARGDRIRRRKHATIAGVSAVVVAAVAVPIVALTGGGSDDSPDIAPSPTISDPVPVPSLVLAEQNLLTSDDAIYPNGGADWQEIDTFEGDTQGGPASPCQRSSLAELGAEPIFQRQFDFVVTDTRDVEPSLYFNQVVAEFPSGADAQAAYDEVKAWHDDCLPSPAEFYNAGEFTPVAVGIDGSAEVQLSTFGPVDEALDPSGDEGWFLETGLVLTGDRVAMLTQVVHGQDYNWPEGTPVEQMLPVAAERLALGNDETAPEDPSDTGEGPTTIPEDFPLTAGWPEDDGSSEYQLDQPSIDNQAMIPAGDLDGCQSIDAGDASDRLTARLSIGSSAYSREVQLFASPDDAGAFLDSAQDSFSACAAEGPTDTVPSFTTEVLSIGVGQESWLVTRASDGIGRVVIYLVRVGNAVFIHLASDEGTGDTVHALVSESGTSFADVIRAMYDLEGGDPAPDLNAPAATTEIPDNFPLDAVVDGEPPTSDGETTVDGPGADVAGVRAQTACGATLSMPNAGDPDPEHELGYSVSALVGYEGRTLRAYPTVQDALDQLTQLRADLQGCDSDSEGDGLSDRLWRTFANHSGYDAVTFGYTYEIEDGVGAPAGQLYTVVRVGNAVVAIEWSGEYSAEYQTTAAPDQVELARLIAAEMCIFTVDGC